MAMVAHWRLLPAIKMEMKLLVIALKKLKKLYIKESDERQAQIVAKALCEAMRATLILGLAAVIVAGDFSMTVSLTLLVTVLLVSLMTLAFKLYFGKKY